MKSSIIVQNLKCGGCVNTIIDKLSSIKNISNVTVDKDTSTVSFRTLNSDDAFIVKSKLKSLGYPSIEDQNGLHSKTKSFISCASGKLKK
ncbi:heavy metal-associated domain-containing protein [Lacinutrix sp. MedPE-SW]|uniref:heavy-metal-associated domain-containing protein n=1 Tax=Lacinutrix sp. MedPE-SW TaxID=1860087 RepID=UPI0009191561|nr:heavy metal-associated domain-containing protein [Lacinutrix sp. MedPE-SW]OIQ19479.1 MAG: heavy metal transporter [Lacinutrix sp. MedPE-SW]